MQKYNNDLYRVVYAVLRDQQEAEDVTQEAFLKIYLSLSQYDHQGFKTWITRIAVNTAIDVKRKQARRPVELREIVDDGEKTHSVEKTVLSKEKQIFIQQKLHELPNNYRDIIYDFYIAEKSYGQIAQEQNLQVKTVEMKLYRARHWIRKHWKEEDFW